MAFRPGRAGEAGRIGDRVDVPAEAGVDRRADARRQLRETMPTGISAVADVALKAGRLAQGIEVKLADGQTLPFGPPK